MGAAGGTKTGLIESSSIGKSGSGNSRLGEIRKLERLLYCIDISDPHTAGSVKIGGCNNIVEHAEWGCDLIGKSIAQAVDAELKTLHDIPIVIADDRITIDVENVRPRKLHG